MGNIKRAQGDLESAVVLYQRALAIKEDYAEAYSNLGVALFELNYLAEAETALHKSISIDPKNDLSYCNLGVTLESLGRIDEAIKAQETALTLNPDNATALYNLGNIFSSQKDFDQAIQSYKAALRIYPEYIDAMANLGAVHHANREYESALTVYDQLLNISSHLAEVYSNKGVVLHDMGQYEAAIECYYTAIQLRTHYPEAHYNLGNTLSHQGKHSESLGCYDMAITFKENYHEAFSNRGVNHHKLEQYDLALLDFDRAIALSPQYYEAHTNKGVTLHKLGAYEAAIDQFIKALQIKEDYAQAASNLGTTFQELRRFDEALESYNHAITINPDFEEAQWNKALLLLTLGRYEEGFLQYEWRLRKSNPDYDVLQLRRTLPNRSALKGSRILIVYEQGLGDVIMFMRYALELIDRALRVSMVVPNELVEIARSMSPQIEILDKDEERPAADFILPMMSLPMIMGSQLDTVPNHLPYIHAEPGKVLAWEDLLKDSRRFRIGLVATGSTAHDNDHNRSVSLKHFEPLYELAADFFLLQKEIRPNDQEYLNENPHIAYYNHLLKDFSDTAALAHQMDVIVTVDTSVAHLCAALGLKVFMLLPYTSDWRWMLGMESSPWYPTMRLFRQSRRDLWDDVIERIKTTLAISPLLGD